MRVAKLVLGIITVVFAPVAIAFGLFYIFLSAAMLAAGIVSIAARNSRAASFVCFTLYFLSGTFGCLTKLYIPAAGKFYVVFLIALALFHLMATWAQRYDEDTQKVSVMPCLVCGAVVVLGGIMTVVMTANSNYFPSYIENGHTAQTTEKVHEKDDPVNGFIEGFKEGYYGKTEQTEKLEPVPEDTAGNYAVTIKDATVVNGKNGTPIIIVTYNYTNNSDDAESMGSAFYETVYQNGVEVDRAYSFDIPDDIPYDSSNYSRNVKPGVTIEVQQAYELFDASSPVEIELKELFNYFNNSSFSYTITLT